MTLLEQANVAIEAGKLDEWLEALSDDDRKQFIEEFYEGLGTVSRVLSVYNMIAMALNENETCPFCGCEKCE